MSVNPGFGGQEYIPTSTGKIARVRELLVQRGLDQVELEVDGGIAPGNAAEVVSAGASVLVAGSAVYNTRASIAENLRALRATAEAEL
jgi:ribulose-phosphate 3-epimerase